MRCWLPLVVAGCTTYTPPPSGQLDAGDDAHSTPVDGVVTDGLFSCPADYLTIARGQLGHKYKLLSPGIWLDQHERCFLDSTYLAIPETTDEASGLTMLVGGTLWVGLDDRVQEGKVVDSKGVVFTGTVQMNDAAFDCVGIKEPDILTAEDCSGVLPAVCECEQ